MTLRFFLLATATGLAFAGSVSADENVREVQQQLRDGGFYSGEIDGAYSSQLAEALTRYQTRNNLPVTGQLDVDTSNALGAKPAVTKNRAAPERSSDTSRRSRNGEQQTSASARRLETAATEAQETLSPHAEETENSTEAQPRSAPAGRPATAGTSSEITETASAITGPASPTTGPEGTRPVSAPPTTVASSSGDGDISTERLRDYVGAFVHAGMDPSAGSEADFFADRVKYYDQGVIDREQVRNDLQNYAAHWPERHFWFVGNITIEPEHRKRVRVTFPLRYELRNGAAHSSGTVNKTLVLEPAGDHLQIVAVSERDAE